MCNIRLLTAKFHNNAQLFGVPSDKQKQYAVKIRQQIKTDEWNGIMLCLRDSYFSRALTVAVH